MKYMLLIYDDPAVYEGDQGRKLMSEMIAGHMRLGEDLRAAGVTYSGSQLQPPTVATTVRNAGEAQTLHDGPFAETKEQLLGFHLMEFDTDDEVIAAARKLRQVNPTAVYEIRPVKLYVPADGFGATASEG